MNTTTWNADFAAYAEMRILIVDDEPANVALLEDMLSDQSYVQVKSTTDSREVVELCSEFDPDLILLDLFMPHMDGFTVLEALSGNRTKFFFQSLSSPPM
jgi:Response regulator containing CheY-like receiver, AAA-type ATPase, and DNA-binding domains